MIRIRAMNRDSVHTAMTNGRIHASKSTQRTYDGWKFGHTLLCACGKISGTCCNVRSVAMETKHTVWLDSLVVGRWKKARQTTAAAQRACQHSPVRVLVCVIQHQLKVLLRSIFTCAFLALAFRTLFQRYSLSNRQSHGDDQFIATVELDTLAATLVAICNQFHIYVSWSMDFHCNFPFRWFCWKRNNPFSFPFVSHFKESTKWFVEFWPISKVTCVDNWRGHRDNILNKSSVLCRVYQSNFTSIEVIATVEWPFIIPNSVGIKIRLKDKRTERLIRADSKGKSPLLKLENR